MGNKPLSREFLLSRGWCCKNGCVNCPYTPITLERILRKIKFQIPLTQEEKQMYEQK